MILMSMDSILRQRLNVDNQQERYIIKEDNQEDPSSYYLLSKQEPHG